ncbi:MAG: class I lanthipeptide [Hyphomicrobiales bacterium]
MKKQKSLSLKKETIAMLSTKEMAHQVGGIKDVKLTRATCISYVDDVTCVGATCPCAPPMTERCQSIFC